MTVNKKYFDDLMQDKRISLRSIAKHMNVSPSQLSRTLTGHRRMQMSEAAALAALLGTSVVEVMINAGIEGARSDHRYAAIIGHLQDGFSVAPANPNVIEKVPLPGCVPHDTEAVQARTATTALSYLDGWIFFIGPQMKPSEATGCYALINMVDRQVIGVIGKGYQPGLFNITITPNVTLQNQKVTWVRKIYFTQHA